MSRLSSSWSGPDSEGSDNWLFDSITRYDELCIYDLTEPLRALSNCADELLAAASADELLLFRPPKKLITNGAFHSRDFRVEAGARVALKGVRRLHLVGSSIVVCQSRRISVWRVKQDSDLLEQAEQKTFDEEIRKFRVDSQEKSLLAIFDTFVLLIDLSDLTSEKRFDFDVAIEDATLKPDGVVRIVDTGGNLYDGEKRVGAIEDDFKKPTFCPANPDLIASLTPSDSSRLAVYEVSEGHCGLKAAASIDSGDDEELRLWTNFYWNRDDEIVGIVDDEQVWVMKLEGDALRTRFRHDGHKGIITATASHARVDRLHFSADKWFGLQAWKFDKNK